MARTDVKKSKEACWVDCPLENFRDERHLLLPSTRESSTAVRDKSMVKDWERNTIVTRMDENLFDHEWLDMHWRGWTNISIIHADGTVEDPAEPILKNKIILVNNRPIDFYLWLQQATRDLATAAQSQVEGQRETFQGVPAVQAGSPEPEL